MSLNPGRVEFGMRSTSVLSPTLTQKYQLPVHQSI